MAGVDPEAPQDPPGGRLLEVLLTDSPPSPSGMDEMLLGDEWAYYRIDPSAAGDGVRGNPEAMRDIAKRLADDVLAPLQAVADAVPVLPAGAAGAWDTPAGYQQVLDRAHGATSETLRFVADQISTVVDNILATARTLEDGDAQAGRAAGAPART